MRKQIVAVTLSLSVGVMLAANTAVSSTPPTPPTPLTQANTAAPLLLSQTLSDRAVQNDDDDDDEEVYVALDADGNGKADNKDGDRQPDHYVRVLVKFAKHCGIPVVLCAIEGVAGPLMYICAFRAGWNCAAAYDDR
jgi:hypothetical protein